LFVKVHKPLKLTGGNNKGSSFNLIEYLSKENKDLERDDMDYDGFFNSHHDDISDNKAVQIIDGNNHRLSARDTKFYMLSFNPSWEEQKHLVEMASNGKTNIIEELSPVENLQFRQYLKDYTNDAMELYANTFSRKDKEGNEIILEAKDLNYVAKVESKRDYSIWDKNVKNNLAIKKKIDKKLRQNESSNNPAKIILNKRAIKDLESQYLRDDNGRIQTEKGNIIFQGTEKGGWNYHVHVVVSRNTKSKWYKGEKVVDEKGNPLVSDSKIISKARGMQLSPNAKGTGKSEKHQLNDEKVHVGFHQEKFKTDSSSLFNEKFGYKPKEFDQYKGTTYKSVSPQSKQLIARLSKKPLNKAKGVAIGKTLGDAAIAERKALALVSNPKAAAMMELKQKVKEILLAKGMAG
tara:strand:- start:167 stop:1384 length:1218 start_codon:yes stop_codon:yes gene_type:complete